MKKLTQLGVAIAIPAIVWTGVTYQADAATVNLNQQGNITSISNLTVNGATYNVNFVEGDISTVYNNVSEPSVLYPTAINSQLFGDSPPSDAINQALNQLTPIPGYISPSNSSVLSRSYFIPFRLRVVDPSFSSYTVDTDQGSYVYYPDSPPDQQPFENFWYGNYQTIGSDDSVTYAVFTSVPEPADILGSLAALGLLVAMKKRLALRITN